MTVWGIEMLTLEQDAQLFELMRWRKELMLAGFNAQEYVLNLCDDHTDLLGSPAQLVGLMIEDERGWERTLYFENGTWKILTPGIRQSVAFEVGVGMLKEFMEIP